jgi:UDP-glucose 4-epimerase
MRGLTDMDFERFFRDKRILITGGLGFIGSNLARSLIALGAQVRLADSLIPEYGGNSFNIADIAHKVHVNISDVRDPHSIARLVADSDILFNLAGQTSHLDSMRDPFTDLEINSKAQLSILEACRHHNPGIMAVFASTRQIYGKPEYLPADERHPLKPVDVNGINKLSGEMFHILYSEVYGIRTCVLRLTNTYGPRMRIKDARQTFVGIWIRSLVEGKPFEVWGGEQLRDFTYVDDCVQALLLAASTEGANGHIYNLGGNQVVSLLDLAKLLVSVNGEGRFTVREFPNERKKIDIGDYYSDYRFIERSLNWTPTIELAEGLRRTLEYYRKNLDHYL